MEYFHLERVLKDTKLCVSTHWVQILLIQIYGLCNMRHKVIQLDWVFQRNQTLFLLYREIHLAIISLCLPFAVWLTRNCGATALPTANTPERPSSWTLVKRERTFFWLLRQNYCPEVLHMPKYRWTSKKYSNLLPLTGCNRLALSLTRWRSEEWR